MMVKMANRTSKFFKMAICQILISLRTLISWGRNIEIFADVRTAFILNFLVKVIDDEKLIIIEFYQRCWQRN